MRIGSGRIVAIDEAVLDAEMPGKVLAQRTHSVTLCGVMTGGEEAEAVLPRDMCGGLGNLSGDIGIHSGGHRLLDITLGRAGTRATRWIGLCPSTISGSRPNACPILALNSPGASDSGSEPTRPTDRGLPGSSGPSTLQTKQGGQLHVVAHLRMHIGGRW